MFNVVRPIDIPASLATRVSYDGQDVYDVLDSIFFGKCYLCETKEPQDINVEHFYSHKGDIDKKYAWNNLYLACSRCNNIKSTAFDNILDCCDDSLNVSTAIKHLPGLSAYAKSVQIVAVAQDEKTQKTAELLEKIYNSDHTVNKKISGFSLRRKIFDQYNLLILQMNSYYSPIATAEDRILAISRIKVLIGRSSPYSAFMRWCILEDDKLGPELAGFMD